MSSLFKSRLAVGGICLIALCLLAGMALSLANGQSRPSGPLPPPTPPNAPWDATAYEWKPVAIGGGGFITGYSADRTGETRVVRADVYGAYLWGGAADRWVQLVTSATMPAGDVAPMKVNEGVFEVAVAPNDANRIYLALAGGVYRSNDRGRHFIRTSLPQARFDPNGKFRHYGPFMAVSPDNPDVVLFGTPEAGLWRTADGGATWERVSTVPAGGDLRPDDAGLQSSGTVIWFAPRRGEVWAMSPTHGVFRSLDAGVTFQPLTRGPVGPRTLRQGQFAPDGSFYGVDVEGEAVWKFEGGAWANLTDHSGMRAARWGSVAVNPRNGEVFVFDEGGRVVSSTDGGRRWSRRGRHVRVGQGEPEWLHVTDKSFFPTGQVVFDPVVKDRIWGATGTGTYFADIADGGDIDWISQVRGIEELVTNDISTPPGHAPLFGVWDFGVHVKPDLDAFSATYGPKERVLIAVQQLAYSASDPNFVVTNASDTHTFCCSEDGDSILAGFSTDGGVSWSKFPSLPTPPGTNARDPWRMSFGSIAVSTHDNDNIVWAPTWNRSPFYTRDRGATWSRVVLPGETLPFTGSHRDFFYPRRTLAADSVEKGVFYWFHSGDGANARLAGLWVTRDGGEHWSQAYVGEIAPNSRNSAKLRVVPGHAGHLFFTSDVAGAPDAALRRSVDGGRTWTRLDRLTDVHDIAFGKAAPGATYPAIYVAGRVSGTYGLWRSTDDAATWIQVGQYPIGILDQVITLGADQDAFGRVYVGFKGSSFVYGQPSRCAPAPYAFGARSECHAADAPRPR